MQELIHESKIEEATDGLKRVVIGGETYVICPECDGSGVYRKILPVTGARRRQVTRSRPCRFCEGKARIPHGFWERFQIAKPGQRI